jgi:arylsulfatase A-like enzyme
MPTIRWFFLIVVLIAGSADADDRIPSHSPAPTGPPREVGVPESPNITALSNVNLRRREHQSTQRATRPNVLLIITDDQGYGDLSHHGNPHLRTPHLDQLAKSSVQFERFFVSPVCAPTRASLLTGRYSLRTGTHGVSAGTETMRTEEVTLAEILRDNGYRTGLFGKWHNGEYYPFDPRGQGFQTSFGYNLGHWNNYFNTTLKRNGQPAPTNGFIADVITNAAIEFVTTEAASPFFCYLSLPTPHGPFQVPDAYFERHKKAGLDDRLACIYGMCENLDDNIGRMLKTLDDRKLRDNTIVMFLTDNGPNGARFNASMKGVKGSYHEGGTRVPFFVCVPGLSPRIAKPIAAHLDVLPTLVELCGVPKPNTLSLDGKSLLPLLKGDDANWPSRTLFTQHRLVPKGAPTTGAVRTETHRLVSQNGKWELYDMQTDPNQTTDLAKTQPELVTKLRREFEGWYADVSRGAEGFKPAIPIGHEQENPIELPTPHATFGGGVKFNGKHANNAWLVGWNAPHAFAEWKLNVVREGTYVVQLHYLASEVADIQAKFGDTVVSKKLAATALKQVPSPDRVPREEVYEMEWVVAPLGEVSLAKGDQTLRITSESSLQLKSVRLRFRN